MRNFLRERILAIWEGLRRHPSQEQELFLTLREYFKNPEAKELIHYDPEISHIYKTTNDYLKARALFWQAYGFIQEANHLSEKNPKAEGEILYKYSKAEELFTEALQIVQDLGLVGGELYRGITYHLRRLPTVEERR